MTEELKACPFCGLAPSIEKKYYGKTMFMQIYCNDDACMDKRFSLHERKRAISIWNTRHGESNAGTIKEIK